MQELAHTPKQVTRSMVKYMETHSVLRVGKVPPTQKQAIPRVDKVMDNTTKITTTKRKQLVPKVEKEG